MELLVTIAQVKAAASCKLANLSHNDSGAMPKGSEMSKHKASASRRG